MTLRRQSTKARRRADEAQPVRDALRLQGWCDWCRTDRRRLEIHEIANGPSRQAALDAPCALLLVCRLCHDELHDLPKRAAVCIGLALLRYNRPEAYNLEAFYKLTSRRWPDEQTVELFWQRTLAGRTR